MTRKGRLSLNPDPDSLLAVVGIYQLDPQAVITNRKADFMVSPVTGAAVPSR